MPFGLERYHHSNQSHFITFSCYHRHPYLASDPLNDIFIQSLERTRGQYRSLIYGYVLMPEHIHLLMSEPDVATVATMIQALKVAFVRRSAGSRKPGPFWQKRYYDHNVRNHESFVDKLRYIHRNPVTRGLCSNMREWRWSSFRHYETAEPGPVEIESEWTAIRRTGREPRLLSPNVGLKY